MLSFNLIAKPFLSSEDAVALRTLADICNRSDGIDIKLNWNMMADRDRSRFNDLCVYSDGSLIGYMPMDDFAGKFEITALVAPAYRRQGIFRLMFAAARRELQDRCAFELLLVNYRASESGCAVVKRLGLHYNSSEFCMVASAADIPAAPVSDLILIPVHEENVGELSRMLQITFDDARWSAVETLLRELANPEKSYFLAQVGGEAIGQIGVIAADERIYFRAVGIAPRWRRKGFGRQLLAAAIQNMLNEGHTSFELDVATDNSQALSLYTSCGFRETNIYDYYTVPL